MYEKISSAQDSAEIGFCGGEAKLKLDLTFKRAGCYKLLIQWIFYRRVEVEARLVQVISQVGERERGSRLSAANSTIWSSRESASG